MSRLPRPDPIVLITSLLPSQKRKLREDPSDTSSASSLPKKGQLQRRRAGQSDEAMYVCAGRGCIFFRPQSNSSQHSLCAGRSSAPTTRELEAPVSQPGGDSVADTSSATCVGLVRRF